MRLAHIKQLWLKLRPSTRAVPKTIATDAAAPEKEPLNHVGPIGESMDINGIRLVFGVRWSPITQDARLGSQLRQARKKGYAYYIRTHLGDAVGLIGSLQGKFSGRPHAASLILSEHFSTSGSELYLFEHEQQWSLVGLYDNSPMPGFDTMGTREEIEALAQEFAEINAGQPTRLFGNVKGFSDMSMLLPTQLVERVDRRTSLSFIPNYVLRWTTAAFCVLLVGGFFGINQYLNQMWSEEQAAALMQAANPNTGYEKAIDAALTGAGRVGNYSLNTWRSTLHTLPTQSGGWQLKSLECKAEQCKALWTRHAGNFFDFDNAFPYASNVRPDMVPREDGQAELQTIHPAADVSATVTTQGMPPHQLVRAQLPKIRDAYLQWASFLQDVKLMPRQVSTFSSAKLFGSDGSMDQITRPVVRASWSLESDLWTLRDLFLPNYVVAEKLEIFPIQKTASKTANNVITAQEYRYKITGSFYAQGR